MDIPCPHCAVYRTVAYCHNHECALLCDCTVKVNALIAEHGSLDVEEACLLRYGAMAAQEAVWAFQYDKKGRIGDCCLVLSTLAQRLFEIGRQRDINPRT